jgi:hypothetical protein
MYFAERDTLTIYSARSSQAQRAAVSREFGAILHLGHGDDVVSIEIPCASEVRTHWFSSRLRAALPVDIVLAVDRWLIAMRPCKPRAFAN